MEYYQQLGLKNVFTNKVGNKEITFRNEDIKRDSVSSIEIPRANGEKPAVFEAKTEDNVAMALSLLGVGRVTEQIEARAYVRATTLVDDAFDASEDDAIETAVINLRAILIAREKQQEQQTKQVEEAFALYKLSYPETSKTLEDFKGLGMKDYWVPVLKKIRKDPTVLGAL